MNLQEQAEKEEDELATLKAEKALKNRIKKAQAEKKAIKKESSLTHKFFHAVKEELDRQNLKAKIFAWILEKYGSSSSTTETHYKLFWKGKKTIDEDQKFNIGKDSYLVDLGKVAYYNKKGMPNFFFIKGNALTTSFGASEIIETKNHGQIASSTFFDHMFRRHLWRDSITSALKENKAVTWKDALPFMLGAGAVGVVIGIELARYLV